MATHSPGYILNALLYANFDTRLSRSKEAAIRKPDIEKKNTTETPGAIKNQKLNCAPPPPA